MRRSEGNFPMRRDRGSEMMRSDWGMDPFSGMTGSPWQMMRRMQEDMDQIFSRFFGGEMGPGIGPGMAAGTGSGMGQGMGGSALAQPGMQAGPQWAPSMDISSDAREIRLEADLPGVNKDDIEVTVQDHHLIVRAEMRQEQQQEEGERQYHRRERRYGMFQRVIPLPENVNEEQISCDFRNGVLTVHVPRMEQQQSGARRIQVMDAEQIPAETAAGRNRSREELDMTEGQEAQEQRATGTRRKAA